MFENKKSIMRYARNIKINEIKCVLKHTLSGKNNIKKEFIFLIRLNK